LTLADNPWPAGYKKLKGYKGQWRARFGDWHVLYIIDDAAKEAFFHSVHFSLR
jgi:mRNA-degrading endonuclease RelE of RelBE toxin-antitoxin system